MAEYDPPREIVPIFNPVDWIPYGDDPLTIAEGDGRYLKLVGGVEKGSVVFNQNISVAGTATMSNIRMNPIKIGVDAGLTSQSNHCVAIGTSAGENNQGINSVAIGRLAGQNTQSINAVAIGLQAGEESQNRFAVALGHLAGQNTQSTSAIAIGYEAGRYTQGENAVAIGFDAGNSQQRYRAIAIGEEAGFQNQGTNAIAIGFGAGNVNQHERSIVLNATTSKFNTDGTDRCFINPIRQSDGISTGVLSYNTTSKEITFSQNLNFDSNTLNIDMTNDRVGIDRAPTTTRLEVDGGGSTEGIWVVNNTRSNIHLGNGITDASTQRLSLSQTGSSQQISWTGDGNLNFLQGTTPAIKYVMNGTNGRFGIYESNAITPERTLHIRGDAIRIDRSGGDPGVMMHRYASGGYTTIWKGFQFTVGASGVNNGDFQIQDYGTAVSGGGTRRFTIGNGGNVGIGSNITAPAYSLEVEGTIASRAGYQTRTGTTGSFGSNVYNFNWANPLMDLYVDTTRIGSLAFTDRWVAGEVIQMVNFNQDNANPVAYTFGSTTYGTWVSVSFTPKSTASKIIVQADAEYRIAGNNGDTFWVRVTDAGNQRFEKTQEFRDAAGGGTRSGIMLPLMASYDNTTTTARNITVDFKRGTADDNIELTLGQDRNWCLTITEIKT